MATLLLALLAISTGTELAGQQPAELDSTDWIEMESALTGSDDTFSGASRMHSATASGGAYARTAEGLQFRVELPADMSNAVLNVRYATPGYYTYFKLGKLLKTWCVTVNDGEPIPLVFPPTQSQEHAGEPIWGVTSLAVGPLSAGPHVMTLRPMQDEWQRKGPDLDVLRVTDGFARIPVGVTAEGELPSPVLIEPLRGNRSQPGEQ